MQVNEGPHAAGGPMLDCPAIINFSDSRLLKMSGNRFPCDATSYPRRRESSHLTAVIASKVAHIKRSYNLYY